MTDLIQRLTEAIFRQEGMGLSYANPGNLRGAPWLNNPVIHNGFWIPPSRAAGVAGAAHVVALRVAMGQSLRELISAWAPASDGNETEVYIAHMQDWANIPDAAKPLWDYLEVTGS